MEMSGSPVSGATYLQEQFGINQLKDLTDLGLIFFLPLNILGARSGSPIRRISHGQPNAGFMHNFCPTIRWTSARFLLLEHFPFAFQCRVFLQLLGEISASAQNGVTSLVMMAAKVKKIYVIGWKCFFSQIHPQAHILGRKYFSWLFLKHFFKSNVLTGAVRLR